MGMGLLGLAPLLHQSAAAGERGHSSLAPRDPHFSVKARHVVHVFAQGAPSQRDTWDPKPELTHLHGQPLPGRRGKASGSPFKFATHGQSGIPASEVFRQLAAHVDDLAVIGLMHTDIPGHAVANLMMNTGSASLPKPSLGSWLVYGLGTLNQNLPGFISLRHERARSIPSTTASGRRSFRPVSASCGPRPPSSDPGSGPGPHVQDVYRPSIDFTDTAPAVKDVSDLPADIQDGRGPQ